MYSVLVARVLCAVYCCCVLCRALPKLLCGSSSFPIVCCCRVVIITVVVKAQGAHSIETEEKYREKTQHKTTTAVAAAVVVAAQHSTAFQYLSLLSSSLHWLSRVVAVKATSHESHQIADTFLFPFVFHSRTIIPFTDTKSVGIVIK